MHTSYFLFKRRITSEFTKLLAEQCKQIFHRKLKLLEKWFELQEEQLLEEAFEAESRAQLDSIEHKSHSSNNVSGNNVASSMQSLPSVVRKNSPAIYQNLKTNKMTYIDTPFDKRQSKVTVQINFSSSYNLTPKPNFENPSRTELMTK